MVRNPDLVQDHLDNPDVPGIIFDAQNLEGVRVGAAIVIFELERGGRGRHRSLGYGNLGRRINRRSEAGPHHYLVDRDANVVSLAGAFPAIADGTEDRRILHLYVNLAATMHVTWDSN